MHISPLFFLPAFLGRFLHLPSPWSLMYSLRTLSSWAVQAPLFKPSFAQQALLPIVLVPAFSAHTQNSPFHYRNCFFTASGFFFSTSCACLIWSPVCLKSDTYSCTFSPRYYYYYFLCYGPFYFFSSCLVVLVLTSLSH